MRRNAVKKEQTALRKNTARPAFLLFGLFCIVAVLCAGILPAQERPPQTPTAPATDTSQAPDRRRESATPSREKAREKVFAPLDEIAPPTGQTTASVVMKKNPLVALACSIIPGGGQLYVGSYWKAALAIGGAATLFYQVGRMNSLMRQYGDAYNTVAADSNSTAQQKQNALYVREFYRDARDTYAVYLFGVYVLAAVDAYVGAHLYEFDVSDELKASISVSPLRGLSLTVRR